jgi:futalosine hydrolase
MIKAGVQKNGTLPGWRSGTICDETFVNILICAATAFERSFLRERDEGALRVRVVEMGVGPVNAAHSTTLAIIEQKPDAIVVCGVAGAYPSSGLQVGDVVSASLEIYGDLGARSLSGFLDMRALGFSVVSRPTVLFNEIPIQVFPTNRTVRFVTVSTCTGTESTAREIEARTGGAVENMEGAAVAHVAHIHGVPIGEVRGISNLVTDRDTKSWRLEEAAIAAQEALLKWIDAEAT